MPLKHMIVWPVIPVGCSLYHSALTIFGISRGKASLGECVKVAERPVEVFSKLMLIFSITNAWLNRDEDNDFSQVM